MTAVVTLECEALPSDDVAESPYPPHRNVRVEAPRWKAFGALVGERKRSSWLSDFIDWVIADGPTWVAAAEIARKRGENLGGIIIATLRRYVARNRHLLDEDE